MCIFNQKKYIRSNMKVNLNQNQSNFCSAKLLWSQCFQSCLDWCHHLSSTLVLFFIAATGFQLEMVYQSTTLSGLLFQTCSLFVQLIECSEIL